MEAKTRGKGEDQFFYRGQGKGVVLRSTQTRRPHLSEESWSAEDGASRSGLVKRCPIWEISFSDVDEGKHQKRSMKMQVAEVSRFLAGVKRMCVAGHVVFDEDGSSIFHKMTGEINQLREESGNYCSMFGFLSKVPRQVFTGSEEREPQ